MTIKVRGFVFALISLVFASSCESTNVEPPLWRQAFTHSNDGTRIAYYTSGPVEPGEPPLLVISGGPGSDHRYMRVGGAFAKLAETKTVIMFDQRSTGASGDARAEPVLAAWANDVEAIRKDVGAAQLDLLGHSFGAYVGMAYAEQYEPSVRSLILVGSPPPSLSDNKQLLADVYPDRIQEWVELRRSLQDRFSASEISVFFSMEFANPEIAKKYEAAVSDYEYNIDVNNRLRTSVQDIDFSPTINALEKPVLIVHGRFDAVIAPSVAWDLHKSLQNSTFIVVENAGHLPFVEKPDEFATIVSTFLSTLDE